MKTKHEQIHEIMKIIANSDLPLKIPNRNDCFYRYIDSATNLYAAGYCKQSDVIEEFIKRLEKKWFWLPKKNCELVPVVKISDIYDIAAEFGAEVEK